MAIEDSGFGIQSITLRDNSARIVPSAPTSLNILPSLHPVFTSDGKDNTIVEETGLGTILRHYGDDFLDINVYGQQNLNAEQVVNAGGTAYVCRLLSEDATASHLVLKVGIKKADAITLYKRDGYGNFIRDENGEKIPLTVKETGEDGNEVEVEAKTTGIEVKMAVEYADADTMTRYPTAARLAKHFKTVATDDDGFTMIPLFFMNYYANGKAGDDYGLRIINDFARDEKVNDGRRYQMFMVKKTPKGVSTLDICNGLSFSFNPYATISKLVDSIEGLQNIYQNLDARQQRKQIQIEYYQENYDVLAKTIEEILGEEQAVSEGLDPDYTLRTPTSVADFDFVNGLDKEGYEYDNVVVSTDLTNADLSNYVYMKNGSDGELGTLTGEELQNAKDLLLIKFFNGDVDKSTFLNVLKCDAGIIYDANYSMEVKKAMAGVINWRRDMCVVFDCGFCDTLEEAVGVAKGIQNFIDTDGSENFAIVPHAGITVDRTVNVRVTGTYEMAYGLTRLYKLSPFSVYAGQQNGDAGCVRKTIFDWVIEQSKPIGYQEKLAKQTKLYWATDLGKALSTPAFGNYTGKNVYFFSNASQYYEPTSKLSEFRNGIIVNDIRRIIKLILVKYTFDTAGADAAIEKATSEIVSKIGARYPSNVEITVDLYQTDRDKLINMATCDVYVTFPDIFETWQCTITVDRKD